MTDIQEPYWVAPAEDLPFLDFNREIVPPGASKRWPDGAIGVRCDDDFWAVAALPWSYRDKSIQQIVAEFWPDIEGPQFGPDVDYYRSGLDGDDE